MAEDNSNSPGSYGSGCDENVLPQSKQPKICLVCGDKAKSYHFGGLCCESCKAFFRRSMQNDSFKSFFCINGQKCVVRKDNRRSCQYCRIQKCFSIGMEKGCNLTHLLFHHSQTFNILFKFQQVGFVLMMKSLR